MKRSFVLGIIMVIGGLLSGCGGPNADQLYRDQVHDLNSLADILDQDEAAIQSSADKIKDLQTHLQESAQKLKELKLSDAEIKKLGDKHFDEIFKATQRYTRALQKLAEKNITVPHREGFPLPPVSPSAGN
jgi:chromosome segregation ATPase